MVKDLTASLLTDNVRDALQYCLDTKLRQLESLNSDIRRDEEFLASMKNDAAKCAEYIDDLRHALSR